MKKGRERRDRMTRYGRNCATYEEENVQRVGGGGRRDGQSHREREEGWLVLTPVIALM